MKTKAIITIMLTTMLAMFLGSAMPVRGLEPPSIINHVRLVTEYLIELDGDEYWIQRGGLHVTDPDGLENLFINGEISIEILAPDGNIYPMPGDHLEVETVPDEVPPFVDILWRVERPYPLVLGSYEFTITDRDGLSTTYVTQPTVRVSDRVPNITYPPNFGVIFEANPTFTWEAFSPEPTYYVLSIWWPSGGCSVWRSLNLSPDQLSYTYDGPELIRGETYHLAVVANEEEVVENEIHGVSSRREICFTLSVKESLEAYIEYVDETIQDLPDGAFKNNPNNRKNGFSKKLAEVIVLIDVGEHQAAIDKLQHDIRAKADGSVDGNPKDDWITDPGAQEEMCALIDALIVYLETLL